MSLAVLAFAIYANTLAGGYAFDDGVALLENRFVQAGFRGIPDILTKDAFASYYESLGVSQNQLPAGRYRPLSTLTFALEQGLVGNKVAERHFVNVALYAVLVVAFYWVLRRWLSPGRPAAFLAALIFAVHPIHTEAVANIKGRDELLSCLFFLLTLAFALRHDESGRGRDLGLSLVSYALALLSKEYGLTLLVLLPVLLHLRGRRGAGALFRAVRGHLAVAAAYVVLRLSFVGVSLTPSKELLNNPYLFAAPGEALATKIAVLARYLRLLVWPHPLACDYSYRQIPYVGFGDPAFWVSLTLHGVVLAAGLFLLRRRHPLAFAVTLYLGTLLMVSNLVLDIGATMGERLVFHSSLGFVMVVAWPLGAVLEGGSLWTRRAVWAAVGLLTLAGSAATVARNRAWSNDETLFTTDVAAVPNSALVRTNAGAMLVEQARRLPPGAPRTERLQLARAHLDRALSIHPTLLNAWISRGLASFELGDLDAAEADWRRARELFADHPMVRRNLRALAEEYHRRGAEAGEAKRYGEARVSFEKAVDLAPSDAEMWTNLGKANYWLGERDRARECWSRALALDPNQKGAAAGLRALGSGDR